MIQIEHDRSEYLVIRAGGTLSKQDYEAAVPEIENALRQRAGRPLRVLILLEGFRGWEIDALWQELKFDMRHNDDFGRIAVVGDSRVQEWGTKLSKPFFDAELRYFDEAEREAAEAWLSVAPGG